MKNHLCCAALVVLTVLGCGGTAALQCRWEDGCVCLQCPAGQEPSKACWQIQSPLEKVQCQSCPAGSFSNTFDADLCRPHTSCRSLGRTVEIPGISSGDSICGNCLPGFHSAAMTETSTPSPCKRSEQIRTVGKDPSGGAGAPVNGTVVRTAEEKTAEYAVFALVPVFCIMGLLGILICNILKKKGYRCSADKEGGDEETATPHKEGNCQHIPEDLNEDTISILVRLITEKKENAAALEELLMEYESRQMGTNKGSSIKFPVLSPLVPFCTLPRMCPHQSHLHTISGVSGLAPKHGYCCTRGAQRKWPPVLVPPLDSLKDPLKPQLNSDGCIITTDVSSRFQVAQIPEHKPTIVEPNKTSSQEKRNSLFLGKTFCSTLTGIRRYDSFNPDYGGNRERIYHKSLLFYVILLQHVVILPVATTVYKARTLHRPD
uniref:RELT TNF receptor n=1 Tax=Takifugu rubripes TaxID=31033 RepID=H2SS04_TAKRU